MRFSVPPTDGEVETFEGLKPQSNKRYKFVQSSVRRGSKYNHVSKHIPVRFFGLVISNPQMDLHEDSVVAFGAGGQERHGRADKLFNVAHIAHGSAGNAAHERAPKLVSCQPSSVS